MDEFVLINRGASVGHHARLGRFVSIGPGAVIAGQVTIGDGAVVGAGAVVLPTLKLGKNCVVAAGAVVTRDVPAHCMVAGIPARITKREIPGFGDKAIE
jgi:acetyltransferase-like isoleucine patch superfamily enzyme